MSGRRCETARACLTRGCEARIEHWKLLCGDCLRRLPYARRRALLDAPRHLQMDEAKGSAAWLEQHSPAAEAARRTGEKVDG